MATVHCYDDVLSDYKYRGGSHTVRYEYGMTYDGQYLDGRREGIGIERRKDGSIIYEGQHEGNIRNGYGITREEDGSVDQSGIFKDTELKKAMAERDVMKILQDLKKKTEPEVQPLLFTPPDRQPTPTVQLPPSKAPGCCCGFFKLNSRKK